MWRQGADLGAEGTKVPAVQHHDPDLLLYREVLRTFVRTASGKMQFN